MVILQRATIPLGVLVLPRSSLRCLLRESMVPLSWTLRRWRDSLGLLSHPHCCSLSMLLTHCHPVSNTATCYYLARGPSVAALVSSSNVCCASLRIIILLLMRAYLLLTLRIASSAPQFELGLRARLTPELALGIGRVAALPTTIGTRLHALGRSVARLLVYLDAFKYEAAIADTTACL